MWYSGPSAFRLKPAGGALAPPPDPLHPTWMGDGDGDGAKEPPPDPRSSISRSIGTKKAFFEGFNFLESWILSVSLNKKRYSGRVYLAPNITIHEP